MTEALRSKRRAAVAALLVAGASCYVPAEAGGGFPAAAAQLGGGSGHDAQRVRLDVLTNRVTGLVHAVGGVALANSVLAQDANVRQAHVAIVRNQTVGVTASGGSVNGGVGEDRRDGLAAANSVVLKRGTELQGKTIAILDNRQVRRIEAFGGVALANSILLDQGASNEASRIGILDNQETEVAARDAHVAAVNSVHNEGRIQGSSVLLSRNRGTAQASSGDANVNSVRNAKNASIKNSNIVLQSNRGQVMGAGIVNSVSNSGSISNSQILIARNMGAAGDGGVANSVLNSRSGTISGAKIAIVGNRGTALRGGMVNSVDNHGTLTGKVEIVGNGGTADGGTLNSLVNHGEMNGRVRISGVGNQTKASAGSIVNSVINRGTISSSGSVNIIGSN